MQSDSKSVPSITDLLGKEILFFDGGTGSVLQAQGLKPGELPETWNLIHPDRITGLHYEYFRAGCNIIKTNTFGANCLKFPCRGTQSSPAAGISVPVPDEPGNINCTSELTPIIITVASSAEESIVAFAKPIIIGEQWSTPLTRFLILSISSSVI